METSGSYILSRTVINREVFINNLFNVLSEYSRKMINRLNNGKVRRTDYLSLTPH